MELAPRPQTRLSAEPRTSFYVFGYNSREHLRRIGEILGVTSVQKVSEDRYSYLSGEGSDIIAMRRSGLDGEPFFGLDLETGRDQPIAFRDIAGDTHFGLMNSVHFFQDFGDHEGVMFVNASSLPDGQRFRYSTLGFNSEQSDDYAHLGGITENGGRQDPLMEAIRLAAHFRTLSFSTRDAFIRAHY